MRLEMSVKVTDNTALIQNSIQNQASIINRFILEEAHAKSLLDTPMRTGELRLKVEKTISGLDGTIRWVAPYSVYQETKQFKHYTTAGTGPHFARNSVRDTMNNLEEQIRKVW